MAAGTDHDLELARTALLGLAEIARNTTDLDEIQGAGIYVGILCAKIVEWATVATVAANLAKTCHEFGAQWNSHKGRRLCEIAEKASVIAGIAEAQR